MYSVTKNASAETQRGDDVKRRSKGILVVDNPLSIRLCHVGRICIDDGKVSFLRRIISLVGRSGVFALAALADFRGVVVRRQWSVERRAIGNRTIDPGADVLFRESLGCFSDKKKLVIVSVPLWSLKRNSSNSYITCFSRT
jgi:hypothetical protein